MRIRDFLVFMTPILLILLCVGTGWLLMQHMADQINLPLLAIAGVVLLIGVLALVAVGFKLVGLADPGEALGLPPGSVRGVIALSLVVLFAILTVFLFSSLNGGSRVTIAACLTSSERNDMLRALGTQQVVGSVPSKLTESGTPCIRPPPTMAEIKPPPTPPDVQPSRPTVIAARSSWWNWCVLCSWGWSREPTGGSPPPSMSGPSGATPTTTPPAPPPSGPSASAMPPAAPVTEELYAIYTRDTPNQASTDFAKQLLVLIGTLVTSVASFYFGTKAVSDAQASASGASGPPKPHAVSPTTLNGGGSDALPVIITGEDLNDVAQVRLEFSDGKNINGMNVMSNAGKVETKFMIDAKQPLGAWDVVVTDKQGRSGSLKSAITIGAPKDEHNLHS